MSQSTLGDDELFGEAADEMRSDVETHLGAARAELPAADAVWDTEADNIIGVLNGLGAALDVGDAEDELRQAKKWFSVGERADAFDDAADLAAAIEDVEETLTLVVDAGEQANALTSTMPELRSALQAAADDESED
jgi:hypothetical protein